MNRNIVSSNAMHPLVFTVRRRFPSIISLVFIPPVISLVTFVILSIRFEVGTSLHRISVATIAVVFSGVLPLLYVLYLKKNRIVESYDVPERSQRTNPYLMAAFCSFVGFSLLLLLRPSLPVLLLLWCYAVNTSLLLAINLRWKISAHMMGFTGPLVFLFFVYGWYILLTIPVLVLLGWSRIALRVHSIQEVVAGTTAGVLLTILQLYIHSLFSYSSFSSFVSSPFPFFR